MTSRLPWGDRIKWEEKSKGYRGGITPHHRYRIALKEGYLHIAAELVMHGYGDAIDVVAAAVDRYDMRIINRFITPAHGHIVTYVACKRGQLSLVERSYPAWADLGGEHVTYRQGICAAFAAEYNQPHVLDWLLRQNSQLSLNGAFTTAAMKGSLEVVEWILEKKRLPRDVIKGAVQSGKSNVIEFLTAADTSCVHPDTLINVAREGNVKLFERLCKGKPKSITRQAARGVVMAACRAGSAEIMRIALNWMGSHEWRHDTSTIDAALINAVEANSEECVDIIIRIGHPVTKKNAFITACSLGFQRPAMLLREETWIQKGMLTAAAAGQTSMLVALADPPFTAEVLDKLLVAAAGGANAETVRVLIALGANPLNDDAFTAAAMWSSTVLPVSRALRTLELIDGSNRAWEESLSVVREVEVAKWLVRKKRGPWKNPSLADATLDLLRINGSLM